MATLRLGNKALTAELRKLAAQVHTVLPDGTQMTREEVLSQLIWDQALGREVLETDDHGNKVKKVYPPVAWCQQFLFERMEGKAPIAAADNESGMKAADKVRQLAKDRINAMVPAPSSPPTYKPK